jgi:tetrahydromethanopterin S-methyltransferase subunit F
LDGPEQKKLERSVMSNREPILTVGMVTALVVAVLGLLAAFGLPLSAS